MKKLNKNFILFSGLSLLIGVTLFLILQKTSPLIGHASYYCQSFINNHFFHIPYYISIVPFALMGLILISPFIKVSFSVIKVKFLKQNLEEKAVTNMMLIDVLKNLELEKKTVIVRSNKKFAFCLGIKNPKIYLSTGLISKLSSKETEAVLLHEQYHLESWDNLIQVIASATYVLFPLFPLLKDLIEKYKIEREIKADGFAVEKIGDSEPLINALRKFLLFPNFESIPVAAIADHETLESRIHSLITKNYNHGHFKLAHLFITLVSAFIIGAIFVFPVDAKEIHHQSKDIVVFSCTSDQNLKKFYTKENASHPYTPAR